MKLERLLYLSVMAGVFCLAGTVHAEPVRVGVGQSINALRDKITLERAEKIINTWRDKAKSNVGPHDDPYELASTTREANKALHTLNCDTAVAAKVQQLVYAAFRRISEAGFRGDEYNLTVLCEGGLLSKYLSIGRTGQQPTYVGHGR